MNPLLLLAAGSLVGTAPVGIAAMKWQRRIVLISAPSTQDPALAQQREIFARWRTEAKDRDLSVVEVIGDQVSGVSDSGGALRRKYRLPADGFMAILIGKDGGEKLRSRKPLLGTQLQTVIDAMPMRQSGER
jgi:hypothetical protein